MARARHVDAKDIGGFLIYHPERVQTELNGVIIHHDKLAGNQDPYVWSDPFLHSFCHITQIAPNEGHTIFWVSGDVFPQFTSLFCDLVFVVAAKKYWDERNEIARDDPIVESDAAYEDHYCYAYQHPFKRRRRYTLKANSAKSFQPQLPGGELIDVMPILTATLGQPAAKLQEWMVAEVGSRPVKLTASEVASLYGAIERAAHYKISAKQISQRRALLA